MDTTDFDYKLIKQIDKKYEKNYLISPLSIGYAVSILGDGADGTTHAQIKNYLGNFKTLKDVNVKNKISISNALFIKNQYKNDISNTYTTNTKNTSRAFLLGVLYYILLLPLMLFFYFGSESGSGACYQIYMLGGLFGYTLLYLAVPVAILLFTPLCRKSASGLFFASGIAAFLTFMVLIIDAVILAKFGYHINGLVINLLFTRGGFESMGLDAATILPVIIGFLLLLALFVALALYVARSVKVGEFTERLFSGITTRIAVVVVPVMAILLAMLMVGVADFYRNKNMLCALEAYPISMKIRMRGLMRGLGFKQPKREAVLFSSADGGSLLKNYPANELSFAPESKRLNIVWLVCESLRADMLSKEFMPNSFTLAEKSQHFLKHYSGGHGTRPAMFSMFYGLYGNNWDAFLNAQREPIFFTMLARENYQLLCQTSAKFTYPEFDRTIFASVPKESMIEQKNPDPWKRDEALTTQMLEFISNRDASRPFFTFAFFEATHAPYSFSPEHVVRSDYMDKINYATISPKDAQRLYNRAANAAFGIDIQVGRIILYLINNRLMDNTIILLTGDHGEEFFEKGRIGHNSTFVEEQVRTPLLIHIPGISPRQYTSMTNHIDIVPTVMAAIGVANPPSDYSIGQNLLSPDYNRTHFIVCGWNIQALFTPEYKFILPVGLGNKYIFKNLYTLDDSLCKDSSDFYAKYSTALQTIQTEINCFTKQR
ncbi:MAG: sulfatase-like hydrolase/transferase [Victivallales bacterium]|nr:sulfatase-like hydrolase/transferase [Victivallales bacterium]